MDGYQFALFILAVLILGFVMGKDHEELKRESKKKGNCRSCGSIYKAGCIFCKGKRV